MITLQVFNQQTCQIKTHVVKPTIFPDNTSQVWKLPEDFLQCDMLKIIWNFEHEREIIDLYSLDNLISANYKHLHIPYLPYARQDKKVTNNSTFNLQVFGRLIDSLGFDKITSVDVHNESEASLHIASFENIDVKHIHNALLENYKPDFIVFPDKGAADRYDFSTGQKILCEKVRDQATGEITSFRVKHLYIPEIIPSPLFLIIDDICDGGATFIEVAKSLKAECEKVGKVPLIYLFVTHGVFSKGTDHLRNNGIEKVFTTNSLIKNYQGFKV